MEYLEFLTSASGMGTAVAIVWIVMHYSSKKRESKTLLAEEDEALNLLLDSADKMEERLASLEKILETDDPNWKDKTQ